MTRLCKVSSNAIGNFLVKGFSGPSTPKSVVNSLSSRKAWINTRRDFSSSPNHQIYKDWSNGGYTGKGLVSAGLRQGKYKYDVNSMTTLPQSYNDRLALVSRCKAFGISPLFTYYANPLSMLQFATKYVLSYRFFFIYMARTAFQAVRPLLAFCVFGEIMKLILANISGGLPAFLFSFVLAFEVLYFFLQCYISYTFLTMFFTVMF